MGRSRFREGAAKYYDLGPHHPDDVPFYLGRIRSPDCRVLELGCGTGRVSLSVLERCAVLHGVDHSQSMLDVLRSKVAVAGDPRLHLARADITNFDLGGEFDLIIAPFRVIQNLETDEQLEGLLGCIRAHLASGGRCILNAFHPNRERDELIATWVTEEERLAWQVETDDGYVTCHDRHVRIQMDPLVVFPDLIYRHVVDGEVVDEAILSIAMRCFYPTEFMERIERAGFSVEEAWGGYAGETYGAGSELVVEFALDP